MVMRPLSVFLLLTLAGAARATAQDGEPLVVHGVNFHGNHSIDDYTLRTSIATSQSSAWERKWWLRWTPFGEKRYLDETELRRDVVRLILLYRRAGFDHVAVDTLVQRSSRTVSIDFLIDEGDPLVVESIDVDGVEGILTRRALLRDLPLHVGDPFDRLVFLRSGDSILGTLHNRGYPFAEVFRNFDTDVNRRAVAVSFFVDPGPLAFVDTVEVVGPRTVDDNVVRRMLTVRSGQVFSQERLLESQRELYRLGVFEYVDIALADSSTGDSSDSLVAIRAQVSEGRLKRLQTSLGYGTFDCMRSVTSWTVRDFLGGGRTFDLSVRLSKVGVGPPVEFVPDRLCRVLAQDIESRRSINYELTGSVRFPYVFSPRTQATMAATAERRSEINAYLREAVGGVVSVTRETGFDIPITASYSLSYGKTEADDATFCDRFNLCTPEVLDTLRQFQLQSTLGLNAVMDRTNSLITPSRGYRISADFRYSSEAIGSDPFAQFFKWVAEGRWYGSLGRRAVLAARLRMGAILPPSLTSIGSQNGVEVTPTEERFYSGGPNSVRGFRQNELGPAVYRIERIDIDSSTSPSQADTTFQISPTGGNQLFLANVELRFPIPGFSDRAGAAVFLDGGDVFERRDASGPFQRLRVTPGVGVRFATPLGPLRLDVAYNGYDPDPVTLYDRDLVPVALGYRPEPPGSFFGRLRFNFSIGESF